RFVSAAVGDHYETINLRRTLERARQEGRADVTIGQQYPELRSTLPLVTSLKSMKLRYRAVLIIFPLLWSTFGNVLSNISMRGLRGLEILRLTCYWNQLYSFLHWYWYWWGVIERLKNWRNIAVFVQERKAELSKDELIVEINLEEGLEQAKQFLDEKKPSGLKIGYGKHLVGFIAPQPGFEPLNGSHLYSIITKTLAVSFLEALALEDVVAPPNIVDRQKLADSITAKANWFGPPLLSQMWYEQYSQWNNLQNTKAKKMESPHNRADALSTQSKKINYPVVYSEKSHEK
ncbi:MAG: hypothetical protein KDJ65_03095, partial [Anaerolineae bacterium]|nr:hypothetical protein [Anaerolineae bacterium]